MDEFTVDSLDFIVRCVRNAQRNIGSAAEAAEYAARTGTMSENGMRDIEALRRDLCVMRDELDAIRAAAAGIFHGALEAMTDDTEEE